MPKCKYCQSENMKPLKSWKIHNPKTDADTEITIYLCMNCGKKTRTGKRLPKDED